MTEHQLRKKCHTIAYEGSLMLQILVFFQYEMEAICFYHNIIDN